MSRCRVRLRELRKYAKREGIPFGLTLDDMRSLIGHLPGAGDSVSFERHDLSLGFVRGNVLLRSHKGGQRANEIFPTEVVPAKPVLEGMLLRVVERQLRLNFKGTPDLTVEDVMEIYVAQEGHCRVSGVALLFDRAVHPESLALTRKDPQEPWTKKNAVLVTFALKPFMDRWGEAYLMKVARRIAKHKER